MSHAQCTWLDRILLPKPPHSTPSFLYPAHGSIHCDPHHGGQFGRLAEQSPRHRHFSNESRSLESQYEELLKSALRLRRSNAHSARTAPCGAVLALSGTDTLVSLIPRPVPGHQRLDDRRSPLGASHHKKKKKNFCRQSRRTSTWPPIDKVAQEILLSICKAELKEMNGHEHEQHQASDS